MAIQVIELMSSRPRSIGSTNRVQLKYAILGTDDDDTAMLALASEVPEFYSGMALQQLSIDDYDGGRWLAVAEYSGSTAAAEGETEYEFDTTGGSATIYQSLETVSSKGDGSGTPPNFDRAIRVTRDGPQGVEIQVPSFNFRLKHYFNPNDLSTAYQTTVAGMTPSLNDAPFYGHAAGVVLFKGAQGRAISGELAPVTFFFEAKPIISSLQRSSDLEAHTNVRGHDVVWEAYRYAEDSAATFVGPKAFASYVEKVFELKDFSQLGIGTG